MLPAATEVAGGYVSSSLATNDNAQAVFGCKAIRQATGVVLIRTARAIPIGKGRIWITILSGVNFVISEVEQLNTTDWQVSTFVQGVTGGDTLTQAASNKTFVFGISQLPD